MFLFALYDHHAFLSNASQNCLVIVRIGAGSSIKLSPHFDTETWRVIMSQNTKTSVYYFSQLLIIVFAIATGSPARADDSSVHMKPDTVSPLTAISTQVHIHSSQ